MAKHETEVGFRAPPGRYTTEEDRSVSCGVFFSLRRSFSSACGESQASTSFSTSWEAPRYTHSCFGVATHLVRTLSLPLGKIRRSFQKERGRAYKILRAVPSSFNGKFEPDPRIPTHLVSSRSRSFWLPGFSWTTPSTGATTFIHAPLVRLRTCHEAETSGLVLRCLPSCLKLRMLSGILTKKFSLILIKLPRLTASQEFERLQHLRRRTLD